LLIAPTLGKLAADEDVLSKNGLLLFYLLHEVGKNWSSAAELSSAASNSCTSVFCCSPQFLLPLLLDLFFYVISFIPYLSIDFYFTASFIRLSSP
jgi:hypothetical protein